MEQRLRERGARLKQRQASPNAIFTPLEDDKRPRRPIVVLFFAFYDHIGSLIALNLMTFAVSLPFLIVLLGILGGHFRIEFLGPLLVGLVIAAPAWAAASHYCAKVVEDNSLPSLRDFWRDYRTFWGRAVLLALGQTAVTFALAYVTVWYAGQHVVLFKVLSIISLYLLLFALLMGLYLWPLMVRGYRWRFMVRNAFVLVAAAPLRTLGIALVVYVLGAFLAVTGIGLVVFVFALWAMIPNQAIVITREQLEAKAAAIKGDKSSRAIES